jgi:hypothetical protein
MMTLEDGLLFATWANAALSFSCEDRPLQNFEMVAIRLLD